MGLIYLLPLQDTWLTAHMVCDTAVRYKLFFFTSPPTQQQLFRMKDHYDVYVGYIYD